MNIDTNTKQLLMMQQALGALEVTTDSDIYNFNIEEKAGTAPAQYAFREITEAIDLLRARLIGA
jgi:hypothetical protein